MGEKISPDVGLEPTTLRLRVSCSTDCANRARTTSCHIDSWILTRLAHHFRINSQTSSAASTLYPLSQTARSCLANPSYHSCPPTSTPRHIYATLSSRSCTPDCTIAYHALCPPLCHLCIQKKYQTPGKTTLHLAKACGCTFRT